MADFLKSFWRTHVFFGATGTPVFGFLVTSPLGFQSQSGFCLIRIAEANVMYIPRDSSLVLHLPTSWQPAVQPATSPHASAEVGLGLDVVFYNLLLKEFHHMNRLPVL